MAKNYTYVPGAAYPYQYKYEHMAVTTDCVIFTFENRQLKVLLVRRGGEPFKGEWAFPGGFLRIDENALDGALRELREETGLEPAAIEQLGVYSDVDRDPRERVITIAWYALVKPSEVIGGDDADEAAWFPVESLPHLAFDHDRIFQEAMERLRRDIHFQPIGFDLMDETFSIPDLQALYEAILGVKFDRRNFQRKLLASGILEEVEPEEAIEGIPVESCRLPEPMMDACYFPDMEYDEAPTFLAEAPSHTRNHRKGRQGRIPTRFRLNRERYAEMKEDGGKVEF